MIVLIITSIFKLFNTLFEYFLFLKHGGDKLTKTFQ